MLFQQIKKFLISFDIRGFFTYFFVGLGATVIEWVLFWISTRYFEIHYLVSTTMCMFISTFANWLFGRLLMFRAVTGKHVITEIAQIYLTSIVGWLANMLLMWLLVSRLFFYPMLSKMVATGIVFVYNYLVRKFFIYKRQMCAATNTK